MLWKKFVKELNYRMFSTRIAYHMSQLPKQIHSRLHLKQLEHFLDIGLKMLIIVLALKMCLWDYLANKSRQYLSDRQSPGTFYRDHGNRFESEDRKSTRLNSSH